MLTTKDMGDGSALITCSGFPGIGAEIVPREVNCARQNAAPRMSACTEMPAGIGLNPGYFGGGMVGSPGRPVGARRRSEQPELHRAESQPRAGAWPLEGHTEDHHALSNHFDGMLGDLGNAAPPRRWTAPIKKRSISSPARRRGCVQPPIAKTPVCRDPYGRHRWGKHPFWPCRLVEAEQGTLSPSTSAVGTTTGTTKAGYGTSSAPGRWNASTACSPTWKSAAF